jgi:hypothetical protein
VRDRQVGNRPFYAAIAPPGGNATSSDHGWPELRRNSGWQMRASVGGSQSGVERIIVYFIGAIAAHVRITDLTGIAPAVSLLALGITSLALAMARW